VRVFKNKAFARFARKCDITDLALCQAIQEADEGLIAADLGGGVIKQRIGRPGRGKSSGFRTLIVFRAGTRAFFVHGFAKSEKDNIDRAELAALKKLARDLLSYDEASLKRAIAFGTLVEVECDEETV
jgi:hypothetical protein